MTRVARSRTPAGAAAAYSLAALFALGALSGCLDDGTPSASASDAGCNKWLRAEPRYPQPVVVLETTKGTIEAEICADAVPATAKNFLDLAESGFYDDTHFHRIIPGFMMQGGDPLSKDADPANDETGGSDTEIPDEFHHLLRHEGRGVLSMANRGPNTGTSQFFITFADASHLDDKHAVFGQVVSGWGVLDAVEKVGTGAGTPTESVALLTATVRWPSDAEKRAGEGPVRLSLWSPDPEHRVPSTGGTTEFVVVAVSETNRMVEVRISGEDAEGVVAGMERDFQEFHLPAFQRVAFLVPANVAEDAPEISVIRVGIASGDTLATTNLTVTRSDGVGPATVGNGDKVRGHYIGLTVDGRIFDTSVESLARDDTVLKYGTFQKRPTYSPFEFTVGTGVIQGFTDIAMGTPEGGQSSGRVPPAKAYGESGQSQLAGRTLIFQLEVLAIVG